MRKILKGIFTAVISFALTLLTVVAGVFPATISVSAEETITYEQTNVMDDLKGSTINGKEFSLTDYNFDAYIELVLKHFPWFLTGTVAWCIFNHMRENIGRQVLQHNEAKNCGFIRELPIVSMSCGSMGKKKTTQTTDMSMSQTVMFRQEAFKRLQKQDMKFPFFPWICFEKELQACMEYGRVYNLASIRTWVAQKRERYEKHGNANWQLYGYDVCR